MNVSGDLTGKVDTCRGDSGGPLVYKNDDGNHNYPLIKLTL